MERPAKGTKGFLLYSPIFKDYFFRVYSADKKDYKDYDLRFADMEIEILDNFVALYEDEDHEGNCENKLDYSSKTLGKDKPS